MPASQRKTSPADPVAIRRRRVTNTITHEIGHIICGLGHPDQDSGPAPLPGTNHRERLMVSGLPGKIISGTRLVKGEWDEAEAWFKNRPNGDQ